MQSLQQHRYTFQKHFPNNRKYHKIFNKNNVKNSYSCIANIKSIVNMHNKDVIEEKETRAVNCKCINKPDYHLSNQFQITSIIYETKIPSNFRKYHEKLYHGSSEGSFKQRHGNLKKSFNHENRRTDTEL